MERRISSSFTEFYKVYGVLYVVIIFVIFFRFRLFDPLDLWFSVFVSFIVVLNAVFAIDFWRMKEVEMTDSGLLVSRRTFFKQKIIFVPYEQIKSVKNKYWWIGNAKRISIKFTENTDFGKEITFISKSVTRISQAEIIEELNQTIIRNKTSDKLNAAYQEFSN